MTVSRLKLHPIFVLVVFAPCLCLAQETDSLGHSRVARMGDTNEVVHLTITVSDSAYLLGHEFILEGSERVVLDSITVLQGPSDYHLNYRWGIIWFSRTQLRRLLSTDTTRSLIVTIKALPVTFQKEYALRDIIRRTDSLGRVQASVQSRPTPFSTEDIFGGDLQKSGSIVRGFTLGSHRDLTLSSGFRMQLSGKLSRDLNIVAALTDENSPIQPEGTTRTLQELDKVFVDLAATSYGATLGDFNLEVDSKKGGEFGRLSRKLQGASGRMRFGQEDKNEPAADLTITGATTRGKFVTNQFQGIEGNQGPYRLKGRFGESRLLVIAGTEKVYVNGELMVRGETNDYTIDYATGEILFMTRRLITNASRMTVDFEYTDREFSRNLIALNAGSSLWDETLRLRLNLVQEADDPDSPIEADLDAAARERLRASGNDRFKASQPGIRFVGRDSVTNVGRGQYILRDTTIQGKKRSILQYAPGDGEALYSASFSFVDPMPADSIGYVRVGAGQFRVSGIGQGNYLPLQFLPLPQLHRVMNLHTTAAITEGLLFVAEYAVSDFDRNRFSPLDDADNTGGAFKLMAQYAPSKVRIGNWDLGELRLSLSDRFVDRRFVPVDRTNEIEFDRKWDLPGLVPQHEEIREASLFFRPRASLSLGAGFGQLERQGAFSSSRGRASVQLADSAWPTADYELESIRSENLLSGDRSSWIRQRGGLTHTICKFVPGIRFESEERVARREGNDRTLPGSFGLMEIVPRLAVEDIGRMSASAEFQFRTEDSVSTDGLQRASASVAQRYGWSLNDWGALSSNLTLSIRKTSFMEEFKKRGNRDADVILVRSFSRYAPLRRAIDAELLYEFSNQRSAQIERVFVRVQKGSGNYRYLGDLNGNGIADDNEFELTRFDGDFVLLSLPGDQLIPVLDLKTSLRLRLQPERYLGTTISTFGSILRALSSETYVRVEERSTETDAKKIYLLNFQHFQRDETTLAGTTLFTQDLHVFEQSPDLSFRLRYQQREGMAKLVNVTDRSTTRERSIRMRAQLVSEIGNQTELVKKEDRVSSTGPSLRDRDLHSNELISDFLYRPEPTWEIGFKVHVGRATDTFGDGEAIADINQQSLRWAYALFGSGQLRGEVRREEVVLSGRRGDPTRPLPFEFTGGRVPGQSYFWQLAFDYRIYQHVQVTLNYNRRSEGGRPVVHLARAEVRGFF